MEEPKDLLPTHTKSQNQDQNQQQTTNTTPDLDEKNQRRGFLIVIEGLDRSGKTTQCELFTSRLQVCGYKARYQKFPDRSTSTGKIINAYLSSASATAAAEEGEELSDHAIHLLFSANRWEVISSIVRDIHSGVNVVVDRYSFSGAVYSAAKQREDLGLDWAWAPEVGLPMPDLVVFLDVDQKIARERGGFGEERYENEEMQRDVRALFERLWKDTQKQNLWVETVDAGNEAEVVGDRIWDLYTSLDFEFCGEELGKLQKLE